MKYILYLFICLTTLSCIAKKTTETTLKNNEKIILVNHQKVTCEGVAVMKCFEIKELKDSIIPDSWSISYSNIEGFNFVPGYIYKLKISEKQLDPDEVPADASTIRRTLVKVIEKTEVTINPLNGKWKVVFIDGVDEKLVSQFSPFLVLTNGKLSGFDGCNRAVISSHKV